MTHPRLRRKRPRFNGSPSDHAPTEQWLSQLRTDGVDGTTWPAEPGHVTFGGANGIGLPDGTVQPSGEAETGILYEDAGVPPRTGPAARLRARPRYQPPQPPPPAGYSATTGPMPAIGRLTPAIGDALTHDDQWGPKLIPVPCGHCGAAPPVPDDILERTKILGIVNWLSVQAGWRYDTDFIWTCPPCQQDKAWKARQGTMEVSWQPCARHDGTEDPWQEIRPAGDPRGRCECPVVIKPAAPGRPGVRDCTCPPCTCPGAVTGVDVMLTSWDYLNTGRAISIQYAEDAKAGRR